MTSWRNITPTSPVIFKPTCTRCDEGKWNARHTKAAAAAIDDDDGKIMRQQWSSHVENFPSFRSQVRKSLCSLSPLTVHTCYVCSLRERSNFLNILYVLYSSGTAGRCCIAPGKPYAVCAFNRGQHWNGVMAARLTSNRKSDVNRCIFTWRTILPNFIQSQFETREPQAFLKTVAPNKNITATRWLAN